MFGINFIASVLLFSCLLTTGSSGCRSQANKNSQPGKDSSSNSPSTDKDSIGNLKVVAEGAYSSVETPFVAVIRDAETYAALRRTVTNLPEINGETFTSNVLIAAFLGTRNTGGYSVEITSNTAGEIQLAEKAPGKDVMVPQVITAPFKIVSVPVSGTLPIRISAAPTFRQTAELYRIGAGSFTISGGFAGRSETYQLAGKFEVMRLGELITIGFAVVSSGTTRERSLRDTGTGSVKGNAIAIARMSRGSLIDPPSGDLRVNGNFLGGNRLALDLDTGAVTVPDGYQGKGKIEAEMVAASAN